MEVKGAIFKVYSSYINDIYGNEKWEQIKQESEICQTLFLPIDDYPDEDLVALVAATAKNTGKTIDDILFEFGRYVIPQFYKIYSSYFKPGHTTKQFLLQMDKVHLESTSIISGAVPPRFIYEDPSPDELIMIYNSKRKLCTFLRGLITGVAEHYKEKVEIEELECMKSGFTQCKLRIKFLK